VVAKIRSLLCYCLSNIYETEAELPELGKTGTEPEKRHSPFSINMDAAGAQ
jgi:hypothetical protein